MKTADFTYHAPATLQDALAILAKVAPEDGRVLAGGQSLIPTMAYRLARPAHLVDINKVAGLDKLEVRHGELCIGATVRHAAFHRPAVAGPLGISRIIRCASAAPSAAASPSPIRPRNGAWSPRRSARSWWPRAPAAPA
jgi:CO/xanthine dehydrogenase FAD-binding subunit